MDWTASPAGSLHQEYADNDNVKFLTVLFDLNMPYSCAEWGEIPVGGATQIIDDDPDYEIFNLFESSNSIPSTVWIDHEMRVHDMQNNVFPFYIQSRIDEMLENCGSLCQFVAGDINFDGVLNVIDLVILVEFILGWSEPTEDQFSRGDMNADGVLNVLDAVILVDVILAE